ncbi:hypothetical protein CVT26_010593 [Gymnopilus dilepis]|uniref:Uncharacterized protein n=1 Tax=Gymnopilus dilepis TaxID=231916 RepID=A0A409VZD9_9AGAR|nr:hypothetical protein CVT26_010593 [Gymnopilus dilepis]
MKWSTSILCLSAVAVGAFASPQGVPVLSEYTRLWNVCEAGEPNSYVGVQYADGFVTTFNYGECYPYELPVHGVAAMAVFCKSVTCESNPNPDCTGGAVPPVPVPVPAALTLINVADFVQLLGQGATCQPNGLPL